jgi:hypothetical protein
MPTSIEREAFEIAAELRRNAGNVWVGTPGWHFTRILDRLAAAERITGDKRVKGLKSEVVAMRAALLELLPRVEVVLGEAAEALERQYAAVAQDGR